MSAGLLFAGCAIKDPAIKSELELDPARPYVNATEETSATVAKMGHWWEAFGDPATTELVQTALENSPDIKLAAARVLESSANLGVTRSGWLPTASLSGSATNSSILKEQQAFYGGAEETTTYELGLSASYQINLFGGLLHSHMAARDDLLAAKADRETVVHTIVGQVVKLRVLIAQLDRQLALTRANSKSLAQSLESIERRYAQGISRPLDVRLARENLAASKAAEPELERNLAVTYHTLDVLLGRRPGSGQPLSSALADLPDLEPVPVGLPAALLDRRPDIKSNELRLAAANARIRASVANLFPSLSLSASRSYTQRDDLTDFFLDENIAYRLIASLTQPIFQGGRLRAQVQASKARGEQAAWNYARTILSAIKEVEDAMVAESSARRRLGLIEGRIAEARAAEELAWQQYRGGLANILTVLDTERRRRSAENELVAVQAALWNARVDLYLALGGDWKADEPSADELVGRSGGDKNLLKYNELGVNDG